MAYKCIDQALDSFTSDVLNKLDPLHYGGEIDYSQWYPMSMYSPQGVNMRVAVLISTKQLVNYQNQNQVSQFVDVNIMNNTDAIVMQHDHCLISWRAGDWHYRIFADFVHVLFLIQNGGR